MCKKIAWLRNVCTTLFLMLTGILALAQNTVPITGKITDNNGLPLEGVTIQEQGSSHYATTKKDGIFTLLASSANAVVTISYVGFQPQEIRLDGVHEYNF